MMHITNVATMPAKRNRKVMLWNKILRHQGSSPCFLLIGPQVTEGVLYNPVAEDGDQENPGGQP